MDLSKSNNGSITAKVFVLSCLFCLLVFNFPEAVLAASDESGKEAAPPAEQTEPLSPELENGKKYYFALCAPCHGGMGDGKGYGNTITIPRARDFKSGIYKYRSTPSGQVPTDEDLVRVTKLGNPGTAMPAYGNRYSDDTYLAIVKYIKEKIAPEVFKVSPTPYVIGDPPEVTPEMVQRGRELYINGNCEDCHGKYARGDGENGWDEDMKDAWGDRIYPTNLTHPWELRNFSTVQDLYRSLITGLDGTPMESYRSIYSDDELWALAHYLKSVQISRDIKKILPVEKASSIPKSVNDALWDETEYTDLQFQGKKSFGKILIARITNVRVRAVHSGSEIAFLLEWSDKKPDRGGNKRPPDAVSILFPSVIITSDPWVDKGDRRSTIDVWKWNASDDQAVEAFRKGSQETNKKHRASVKSRSGYSDGLYRVMFVRGLEAKHTNDITFPKRQHILYSIRANDGDNFEKGDRGGKSGHHKIVLQ